MQNTLGTQQTKDPEKVWIEAESMRRILLKIAGTQNLSIVATLLLFALLFNQVPFNHWLTWLALHGAVIALRIWFLKGYKEHLEQKPPYTIAGYFLQFRSVTTLVGLTWGSTVYVFYGANNTLFTALCFDLIAFYGLASTITLSGHAPTARRFILGYSAGVLGALTFKLTDDPNVQLDSTNILLPLVMSLLLYILNVYGKELNKAYMHSLHLQFHNEQLISSLTQEKQTALAAVAAKNRLIAATAHDMRQPVLALDLYSQWLTQDPSASAELTPKITVATQAVIALFDSMFDLAQLVEDKVKIQPDTVNIKGLLEELSIQHQIVAQKKGLVMRTHLHDLAVFTDPVLLRRMVSNLISNAIKYTHRGGILVACRQSNNGVRIEIWDTGTGISEEEQALVFREFYKGPQHTQTNDGYGLGLSIVSQLAEKLNARIEMKSRPGRGTLMAIHLPRVSTS